MTPRFQVLRVNVPKHRGDRYQMTIPAPPDKPIIIGRSETRARVWCGFSPAVSASAAVLVYAADQWWLGNPYRLGTVDKLPIDIRAQRGRVEARLNEGGIAAVPWGESELRIVAPEIGWDRAIRLSIAAEMPSGIADIVGEPVSDPHHETLPSLKVLLDDDMYKPDGTLALHPEPYAADVLAILTYGVRHGTSLALLEYSDVARFTKMNEDALSQRVKRYRVRLEVLLGIDLGDKSDVKTAVCNFVVEHGLITPEDDARVLATWGEPPAKSWGGQQ
jgi:hypothetical protein